MSHPLKRQPQIRASSSTQIDPELGILHGARVLKSPPVNGNWPRIVIPRENINLKGLYNNDGDSTLPVEQHYHYEDVVIKSYLKIIKREVPGVRYPLPGDMLVIKDEEDVRNFSLARLNQGLVIGYAYWLERYYQESEDIKEFSKNGLYFALEMCCILKVPENAELQFGYVSDNLSGVVRNFDFVSCDM